MGSSSVFCAHPVLPGEEPTFVRLDEGEPEPEGVKTVTRNDVIHLDASKMKRTPQGGLRGPAAVSRVGVFRYRHKDGPMAGKIVREFRPPEEVFSPESIATLDQAPITDFHPSEGDGLVKAENFTRLSKGQITAPRDGGDEHVHADAVIQDKGVVKDVLAGRRSDFSPGYTCSMDWTPGSYKGQHYDVIQRTIRYNHVAILPRGAGRQGTSVALRFDAAIITETAMIIHLDGTDYDLSDEKERAAYHAAMNAKVEAAKAETAKEKTRADQAEARADAADEALKPLREKEAREARTALEASARKILGEKGKDVKFDGLTDREVREKVIGPEKCKGKTDEYVNARFDTLVEAPAPAPDGLEAARKALEPDPVITAAKNVNVPMAVTERWKQPLTKSKDK